MNKKHKNKICLKSLARDNKKTPLCLHVYTHIFIFNVAHNHELVIFSLRNVKSLKLFHAFLPFTYIVYLTYVTIILILSKVRQHRIQTITCINFLRVVIVLLC